MLCLRFGSTNRHTLNYKYKGINIGRAMGIKLIKHYCPVSDFISSVNTTEYPSLAVKYLNVSLAGNDCSAIFIYSFQVL